VQHSCKTSLTVYSAVKGSIFHKSLSISIKHRVRLLFTLKQMKILQLLLITIQVISLCVASYAQASEDFSDFAELDLEELLNTTVISASKREQKLSEAPNAIYVITAEDIKRSGAVDVPDLFRLVPGMDVVNVYGGTYGACARGFNERFVSRMLVMVDGRSIYTAFFGGVFWENEQVFLEDIERIEVIRGPGATLWGANAVHGVINIITKDPDEDQGLLVTGKAGSKNFRENVTRYSDTIADKFSFSVTGGYREDEGTRGTNDFRRIPKATGRVKYQLSDRSKVQFFAGFNESESGMELTLFTPRTDAHIRSNYQMLRLEHQFSDTSQFHFQVYRDSYEIHSSDKAVKVDEDKYDVELQHSFTVGDNHHFVWGGNYRSTEVKSRFLKPTSDHDDLIGLFLQDELTILDNLSFVAGIKYENNSFTGGDWSPRGCILYSPWSNHHFRFSVSRAYRTPSFFADKAYLKPLLLPVIQPLNPLLVKGNEHLDPEEMTAFEFGYRTTLFKHIGLNVECYYNELDRIIDAVNPIKIWPFYFRVDNSYNAIAKGIEVSVTLPVRPWWLLKSNYTFQEMESKGEGNDILGTPKHKISLISHFTFNNGFSLDLMAHYVDDTKWSGLTEDVTVDDYVRLDIRIAQKLFNDSVELSFVGQNITDKLHPETSDVTGTYEIERLLYGQVTFSF